MLLFIILILFFSLLVIGLSCYGLYIDSKNKGLNPIPWVLLMIITTPILGFIIYYSFNKKLKSKLSIKDKKKQLNIITALSISILLLIGSSFGLVYAINKSGNIQSGYIVKSR